MPGFQVDGSAVNAENKNNRVETRRKHRWRFQTGFLSQGEWVYLEKAARPSFSLETPEMHHDQEVASFAGKQSWEEITLEFYDTVGDNGPDMTDRLYQWIAGGANNAGADGTGSVVNLEGTVTVNLPSGYKTDVTLQMTDGQGEVLDEWTLFGAWPKSTNWNDLDYSNTEIQRVTTVLRYDRATKTPGEASATGF